MLTDLVVEGLGVIERAELSFGPGSSALTGETGAGKTLVVAALGLLLGGRADRTLVRAGARQARVEGRFVVPDGHVAIGRLAAEGVVERGVEDAAEADEGAGVELIVSRTVPAEGGGAKARVNGRLVPRTLLADIAPVLVEIAGQHEHQRIGSGAWQRTTLDRYAGPEAEALSATVATSVRALRAVERDLDNLGGAARERERELDVLRWQIDEIEGARILPGEHERLAAEAVRLEHAETIAAGLEAADESLRGDRGATESIAAAQTTVEALGVDDPELRPLADRLESARLEVEDVALELRRREVAPDPGALEATNERIAVLSALRRKYGADEEEVLSYLERARARARELESAEEDIAELERRREVLAREGDEGARELSRIRQDAAGRLAAAVQRRLAELALEDARFEVRLEATALGEHGRDAVAFWISANQGEAPKPLGRVASGGELSRISLALHLVARAEAASTMVFDEVDAGVGGAAAQAVGRSLAELARSTGTQVVVVTHLPQVAAFADAHLRVTKGAARGRSAATVAPVEGTERIQELSRMMAGLPESERAQEHARELLELAAVGAVR